MPFRFRLIDSEGIDLGPFVSRRQDWKPGERIGRSKGEDMLITAVIEPEQDAAFQAYLVVSRLGEDASKPDNPLGTSWTYAAVPRYRPNPAALRVSLRPSSFSHANAERPSEVERAAFDPSAFAQSETGDVPPRKWGSVPLALREAAEGDEPDQGDDQSPPEAPDDDEDDPEDHEDPAEADPSDSCVCHVRRPFRSG